MERSLTKIVYNSCFGIFGLSQTAIEKLEQLGAGKIGIDFDEHFCNLPRHHALLVQVVEELGTQASSYYSDLVIAKIEGNRYIIDSYDGCECVQVPSSIEWVQDPSSIEWVIID